MNDLERLPAYTAPSAGADSAVCWSLNLMKLLECWQKNATCGKGMAECMHPLVVMCVISGITSALEAVFWHRRPPMKVFP